MHLERKKMGRSMGKEEGRSQAQAGKKWMKKFAHGTSGTTERQVYLYLGS